VAAGEAGDGISFRIERVATPVDRDTLEGALLGGKAVPGFLPAPASPVRQLDRGRPVRRVGTASGTLSDGQPFRVEYAVVKLRGEAVVARFLGPPDALAFNLGLVRRSLETLEAVPLLTAEVSRPLAANFEAVAWPGVDGRPLAMPAGWSVEPAAASACGSLPRASAGIAASPPGDFTVVLRGLRWPAGSAAVEAAVRACGGQAEGAAAAYAGRLDRLGLPIEVRGVLVPRPGESLLLEVEAPVAKMGFVEALYGSWVREVEGAAGARPR